MILKLHHFVALIAVTAAMQVTAVRAQIGDTNTNPRDARFLQEAAQLGLFQFELSQLAFSQGPTEDVRAYAQGVAADYAEPGGRFNLNGEIAQLMEFHGFELPTTPTKSEQHVLDRLTELAGTDTNRFVRLFVSEAISVDRQSIRLYQKEANTGQELDIQNFAQRMLPILQTHLDEALALRATITPKKRGR
jgi:putative membrane protein